MTNIPCGWINQRAGATQLSAPGRDTSAAKAGKRGDRIIRGKAPMDIVSNAKSRTVRVDRIEQNGMSHTSWGEQSRTRLASTDTLGTLSILDYRAPADFGPPRHQHSADDEIFLLMQGQLVLWTPEKCDTAKPGDLVLLPRGVAHTWRAYGPDPVHMQVITSPGQFETFFKDIVRQGLHVTDIQALTKVAADAGMHIVGPPLSDEDVNNILAGRPVLSLGPDRKPADAA
jgi:uncharacterized cupin superfamily protein